jgi:predicted enzyme related to lactoylglutathione lyase
MKIRTVYFKVNDMQRAVDFYSKFLDLQPQKVSAVWSEFLIGEVRLGLLANIKDDHFVGSNCVPVFEFASNTHLYVEKAISLGARMVADALNDSGIQSARIADPFGNEFEVSKLHN